MMKNLPKILNQALAAYQSQDYQEAERLCRQVLAADPAQSAALLTLGNVAFMRQDYLQAAAFYQQVLVLESDHAAALINLADSYLLARNYAASLDICTQLLNRQAEHPDGLRIRGCALLESGEAVAAIEVFKTLLKIDPTDFWVWNYLSQAYQQSGDFAAALETAFQAVSQSAGADSQHINFAYALYETALEKGRPFVQKYLSAWVEKYPAHPMVKYVAAALDSDTEISKADPLYVQNIFDVFAESFEESLRNLNYAVPRLIAEKIAALPITPQGKKIQILDLGCGTGLVACALVPQLPNAEFDGVDLSPQMLACAEAKHLYRRLKRSDIETFLQDSCEKYDGVVAADVLTYFGTLEKVFCGVASVLKKEGWFVFSVTRNNANKQDYFLHLSGRFHHREKYLRSLLEKQGFRILDFADSVLREEAGEPVGGWIVTAQKL